METAGWMILIGLSSPCAVGSMAMRLFWDSVRERLRGPLVEGQTSPEEGNSEVKGWEKSTLRRREGFGSVLERCSYGALN